MKVVIPEKKTTCATRTRSIGDDFFGIAVLFIRRNTTLVLSDLIGKSIVSGAIRKLERLVASSGWAFVEFAGYHAIPFDGICGETVITHAAFKDEMSESAPGLEENCVRRHGVHEGC